MNKEIFTTKLKATVETTVQERRNLKAVVFFNEHKFEEVAFVPLGIDIDKDHGEIIVYGENPIEDMLIIPLDGSLDYVEDAENFFSTEKDNTLIMLDDLASDRAA